MQQWAISVGEPWDFESLDGQNRLLVISRGQVNGPNATNWAERYLLLEVVNPFEFDGERVELLVAAPRYRGETLAKVEGEGGIVGIARVRPGVKLNVGGAFAVADVAYCMIGSMIPDSPNPAYMDSLQSTRD